MPEECRMQVGDPLSSRAATVSGSVDPKSIRKRSRDQANSTGVSLDGWRRYARYWPWSRGRHGRGRGRPGMSATAVALSMSRIPQASRGRQRPLVPAHKGVVSPIVEEGITTEELVSPPKQPARLDTAVVFNRMRVEGSIAVSAERDVAVKRPRLADGAVAVSPQEVGGTEDTKERSDCAEELRCSDSKACTECETLEMDMSMVKDSRPAVGIMEESVAGEAGNEIALPKGVVDEPVGEPRPAELVVEGGLAGKTGGEAATKESRPEEGALKTLMTDKRDDEIALANRWLPIPYPEYPSSGKFEDFLYYTDQSKRIAKQNKEGFDKIKNLPTWGAEPDQETEASVNIQEGDICLEAGESVVAVSSVVPGHDNIAFYCSGAIISCHEDVEKTVRILTSSGIIYDDDGKLHSPEQKVFVKLSNGLKCEGQVLFVNTHYEIAILEVPVSSSMIALRFGSMPQYGQRVIALGRDSTELFLRDGFISTLERTALGRTHYMFPKSTYGFPVICTGGPVVDQDGVMVGIITCHVPEAAMMSISIVKICLHMWETYSCIARPEINMSLRTVQLLPIEKRDILRCIYDRHCGFVIDGVEYKSTPEKAGIRKGDIVDIVEEGCGSTLPELETYLLSRGLKLLTEMGGLSLKKELELKIRVHDLLQGSRTETGLTLPVVYERALPFRGS